MLTMRTYRAGKRTEKIGDEQLEQQPLSSACRVLLQSLLGWKRGYIRPTQPRSSAGHATTILQTRWGPEGTGPVNPSSLCSFPAVYLHAVFPEAVGQPNHDYTCRRRYFPCRRKTRTCKQ
ncbi:hypothetical protein MRX96_011743 [Rhipicephalus microplus]